MQIKYIQTQNDTYSWFKTTAIIHNQKYNEI